MWTTEILITVTRRCCLPHSMVPWWQQSSWWQLVETCPVDWRAALTKVSLLEVSRSGALVACMRTHSRDEQCALRTAETQASGVGALTRSTLLSRSCC
eukprot:COSAG02_NODE_48003_length_337_cov_0.647059_1_plen_97_part_10